MDNTTSKLYRFCKWVAYILLFMILAFTVYFSVMSMISIKRKVNETNELYSKELDKNKKTNYKYYYDSLYIKLNKERALYQSKLEMAKTDSIGLTINLIDSNANLELNGVIIHKTKISNFKLSKAFTSLDIMAISGIFGDPFIVKNEIATIKKEPIMVKMAPKDTSEYIPDITPDTSNFEPVNYILEMQNGIRLFVYQTEKDSTMSLNNQFYFDLNDRLNTTWDAIKKVSALKVPDYHLYIKIWIPKSDAKIIYRAMPKEGMVVVYF